MIYLNIMPLRVYKIDPGSKVSNLSNEKPSSMVSHRSRAHETMNHHPGQREISLCPELVSFWAENPYT
jgi:hypothetical protein